MVCFLIRRRGGATEVYLLPSPRSTSLGDVVDRRNECDDRLTEGQSLNGRQRDSPHEPLLEVIGGEAVFGHLADGTVRVRVIDRGAATSNEQHARMDVARRDVSAPTDEIRPDDIADHHRVIAEPASFGGHIIQSAGSVDSDLGERVARQHDVQLITRPTLDHVRTRAEVHTKRCSARDR